MTYKEQLDFVLTLDEERFLSLVNWYMDNNPCSTSKVLHKALDSYEVQQRMALADKHNVAVELETCLLHTLQPEITQGTLQIIKNKLSNIRRSLQFKWDWLIDGIV